MYLLLLCSLTAVTVVVERFIFWFKESRKRDEGLIQKIIKCVQNNDYSAAYLAGKDSDDFVVKMLISGITHREYSLSSSLELASGTEVKRMSQFLPAMNTIITLSPLLGIFGTVIGIIKSFEVLGSLGIANPQLVTGGIAEALITTASGLAIAMPTLLAYNYFLGKVDDAMAQMEEYGTSLEIVSMRQRVIDLNGLEPVRDTLRQVDKKLS